METLDEEKETKHEEEGDVELVTEDGEGEEGLCDEHPCLVVQTLEEDGSGGGWYARSGRRTSTSRGCRGPKNILWKIRPERRAHRKPKLARTCWASEEVRGPGGKWETYEDAAAAL